MRIVAFIGCLAASGLCTAQDLTITNARVIDGAGTTIQQGSVVIRDGLVVSISEGSPNGPGDQIDATGMTVLPGFIDTHVHLLTRAATTMAEIYQQVQETLPGEFAEFLEAGFTTILSTADHDPTIFEVRRQLEDGEIIGPRLLAVGPNFTVTGGHPAVTVCRNSRLCREMMPAEIDTPEEARRRVSALANAGADGIKAIYESRNNGPKLSNDALEALAAEAKAHGLHFIVHIASGEDQDEDARTAVRMGADRMAHLQDWAPDVIALIREAGVVVSTTIGRGRVTTPEQAATRTREIAGARRLAEAGVMLAYGTDIYVAGTLSLPPAETLLLQSQALSEAVSNEEVLRMLTSNAAYFLDRTDIGALEPGKMADIVIVDGNPLANIADLGNVAVVIQNGRIVVDNR